MKRINFLKSLLGIAVAPMAIAKAIEQVDVKPEIETGTKGWIEQIKESNSFTWYTKEEKEVEAKFDEEYIKTETKDGYTFIYKRWPVLFPNEKIG